jgi:hypothetical protein
VTFADADTFDWSALPQDGRFTMLASTSRRRYGRMRARTWRPDLHLALWNPYQALDFQAPALMTYGFARRRWTRSTPGWPANWKQPATHRFPALPNKETTPWTTTNQLSATPSCGYPACTWRKACPSSR